MTLSMLKLSFRSMHLVGLVSLWHFIPERLQGAQVLQGQIAAGNTLQNDSRAAVT